MMALSIVKRIAESTVGRWLAQERIRPWRFHTWQHILDPKAFLQRARPILSLYERAKDLLCEGIWVVCSDEKTSIQARRRERQTVPAGRGYPVHLSPRYERCGAVHLFAGLSVADGRAYGMCRNRKRFVDFQAFLLEVILPEALRRGVHTVALVLDNGTTHAPRQLENWLNQVIHEKGWSLRVESHWLPPNASWLDQIEIWFSVLQRKLLQPNDFESVQALVKAIGSFVRYHNRTAKPIHWTYTIEKLEQKLGAH